MLLKWKNIKTLQNLKKVQNVMDNQMFASKQRTEN